MTSEIHYIGDEAYEVFEFPSIDEAQKIIEQMNILCETQGFATHQDLYNVVNDGAISNYGDDWGWFNTAGWVLYEDPHPTKHDGNLWIPRPQRLKRCEESSDNVNHPAHYMSKTGLETIDVIEAFTSDLVGLEAVCTANVIKYVCRWKHKNGLEDLKKAQWYLNKLIEKESN